MRMKKNERGRQAIVGDTIHSHFAVVVGNVFNEPFNRVVCVRSLVRCVGIGQINLGRKLEVALGLETSAQILNDEDVTVLCEFLERWWHLLWSFFRYSVRSAAKKD